MCKSDIYEVYNPNKSGSMLFYSKNGKYLVKTLTGPQRLCFSQMMKPYYKRIEEAKHHGTLLMHVHALFEYDHGGTKVYSTVIQNIFSANIETEYDLKGSTYGRKVNMRSYWISTFINIFPTERTWFVSVCRWMMSRVTHYVMITSE